MSFLGFAVTAPEARGSGAGVALTEASFAWARAHGYEAMVTDWRVTNLLSSRFWPARGFRPTFFRPHRLIA
jgi:GNAT superfamily N-acetyltransferase